MKIKKFLLYIWQLPQNLIGFILTRFAKAKTISTMNDGTKVIIYYTNNVFGCGVSLGNYIVLDYYNYYINGFANERTLNHEHGHQIQSRYLGWFYLIIIGVTSAIFNNLWDRLFHKKWTSLQRYLWYYNRFPENWADKLGGVKR